MKRMINIMAAVWEMVLFSPVLLLILVSLIVVRRDDGEENEL